MCNTRVESLEMDLETFSSNTMRAMEIKDKEIAHLTTELDIIKRAIKVVEDERDLYREKLERYESEDFSNAEEN